MTSTDHVTDGAAPDIDRLRATAANSVKWAVLQMVGATGGRLLFTFALARFLGPEDFGIVAPATIYITLAMLLLDQGFGSALVQRRRLEDGDVRSVATLNLLLALGLVVLTLVLAPAVADFFDTPELTAVLRVLVDRSRRQGPHDRAVGAVATGVPVPRAGDPADRRRRRQRRRRARRRRRWTPATGRSSCRPSSATRSCSSACA